MHDASQHIQELLHALLMFFKYKNAVFNGEQEKEFIIRVRMGWENPSIAITVCHHSARLVMPNSDPQDGFFCPIDSYITSCKFQDSS